MKNAGLLSLAGVFVILSGGIIWAQVTTGTISGTVKDSTGAVLAGAKVVVLNEDTGISRPVQSDAAGRYTASSLSLGNYRVTATLEGFQTEVRTGIVLTVAREAVVDLALTVGAVTQTVEVAGEAPAIETTNATISGLVNEEQIRDLPLNGRSYVDLALLSPGIIYNRTTNSDAPTGFGPRLSVNGSRADANTFLMDGAVVHGINHDTGSVGGLTLGVEGIREFRVLTHNYSAEYGYSSGAVVTAVTRSGTNQLHGSVYEFVRNNIFDARDFFNVGALPAFRRNQFGAAAGGPVRKDQIFFFANYEGLRQRQGNPLIISVPDANARQGLVPNSAGQLQPVPFNPAIVPYLALYPLPNGRNFGDGTAQFIENFSSPTTEDYSLERMDFRLSDKDNFFWRYVYDPSSSTPTPTTSPTFLNSNVSTNHFLALSETHIFSGTALNDFTFAFDRALRGAVTAPAPGVTVDPSLSFLPGATLGSIYFSATNMSGAQLASIGGSRRNPAILLQNNFQETDTFSLVRGAHSLKFGVDLERIQLNNTSGGDTLGSYQFGGLLSLLATSGAKFTFSPIGGDSTRLHGWRRTLFGAFVQDDYRLSSRLALNLGFRYEVFTNPSEVNGRLANLLQITDTTSQLGLAFATSKLNFAPRLGMAWDPTGSGKTSIRVGAGMYYNQVDGRTWTRDSETDYRFFTSYIVKNASFPRGVPAVLPPGSSIEETVKSPLATPTDIHYSLDIQRQLAHSLSLRLGYVGSYGYNQTRTAAQDIAIPLILANGPKFYPLGAPVINPHFSDIEQLLADAHVNYNAFQAVLQKTFSGGLTFQAAYTYSKTLDESDASIDLQINNTLSYAQDVNDLAREYGLSGYDQRQTFVFNAQYLMPWDHLLTSRMSKAFLGGWETDGIYQYGSGLPLDILDGINNSQNGDPNAPDRPNIAPGGSNNPIHGMTTGCQGIPAGQKLGTPNLWFDPCAYVLSTAGTYGSLGRDTVTAPGFNQVSFTLVKNTALTEHKKLEFRAEFFNLFNHPSFGIPINQLFNSPVNRNGNSGVISATTSRGRQIQLGLKLTF